MMKQKNETLTILSILHYVLGGFTALFACFPLFHVAVGIFMLLGGFQMEAGERWVGWLFILFPGIFILLGMTGAVLVIMAGRKLGAHRNKTFCQIVAAIECLMFPFGTALGVTTLVLLSQPENADSFERPSG